MALVVVAASCSHNKQTANENQAPPAARTEQASSPVADIYGTYQGVIPAANTTGISMHLTINSDETFVLTREYQGKRRGSFKDRGKFSFVNGNVIELTDKKGTKTYYRVEKGSVILSDPEGNVGDADFASQYQLRKI